ncbi:MAG: TetR/AcrR family transcriptional regulator, partial [Planctomycetota bacterium]
MNHRSLLVNVLDCYASNETGGARVRTSRPRREREQQRHRSEILTAARELFARQGYEKTTMAQIAEHAEFAVGTLYKFFRDKRSLYRALILETVREFEQALTAALDAPGSARQKIERYIATKMELFHRHLPTARLYFAQTSGARVRPAAGLDADGAAIYEDVLERLERIFERGVRGGEFVDIE